ncbi:MAG: flagellar protein FlgN [Veillonellales bacterium]
MKEIWTKLQSILNEMLEFYQTLLAVSREKRAVLVSGKTRELEAVTKEEEILILQAGKLENRREKIIVEIAAGYGLNTEEITFAKIKELADETDAAQLEQLAKSLEAVVAEIKQLNQVNTKLIQQSLRFIQYNINILTQNTSGPTYEPQGKTTEQTGQGRNLFDRKA